MAEEGFREVFFPPSLSVAPALEAVIFSSRKRLFLRKEVRKDAALARQQT